VQAYDADEGENAAIHYSIAPRDEGGGSTAELPVTVDDRSGWIYTTRELDREEQSRYQFQVRILHSVFVGLNSWRVLHTVIILSDDYHCLLFAAIPVYLYLAFQVARVFTSVSQTFLGVDPSWVQEITVDPHMFDHINIDCPDDK
jgi:Cadherin domain.